MEYLIDWTPEYIASFVNEVHIRREFLRDYACVCPNCRTRQIELLNPKMFARWKCRECKTKFISEPIRNIK